MLEATDTNMKPYTRQKALIIVSETMKSSNTHMFLQTVKEEKRRHAVLITIPIGRKENQYFRNIYIKPENKLQLYSKKAAQNHKHFRFNYKSSIICSFHIATQHCEPSYCLVLLIFWMLVIKNLKIFSTSSKHQNWELYTR